MSRTLTAELLRQELHYNPDDGRFTRLKARGGRKPGDAADYVGLSGYIEIDVCGRTYFGHRLAWLYVHGRWPKQSIDHINRDRADNRIANLRDVPHAINMRNLPRRRDNTSGLAGVYWFKPVQRWMAAIGLSGKQVHLGYYDEWWDAACARKSAENRLWRGSVPPQAQTSI